MNHFSIVKGKSVKVSCYFSYQENLLKEESSQLWGPYVMNTQTEIMEAMRDYQMGKMGFLPAS